MANYTKIPESAFKNLQLNAGIILKDFDVQTGTFDNADILGATTGGINPTATPTFSDFAEDVDNAPKNMLEFKKLESWEVAVTTTFISVNADLTQYLVAVADTVNVEGATDVKKIVPRMDVKKADFKDLWIVCDYSDINYGDDAGFCAVHILNALSTGGFSLQTADKAKGQFSATFTGHVSSDNQDIVPIEIYIKQGKDEAVQTTSYRTTNDED